MGAFLSGLLRSRSGATAIEYAVIAALISVAAASVILSVGTSVSGMFSSIAGSF